MTSLDNLVNHCHGKNISLVGGAQSIFNETYGEMIDSADLVIRMNRNFPKKKKHLGKRTDLLCISCGIKRWQHWFYYRSPPILWMSTNRQSIQEWMLRFKSFYFYDDADWINLSINLENSRPSTGAMTLDFVARYLQPKKLSLFGFDFKKTKTLYQRKQKLGPHNWELERLRAIKLINDATDKGLSWRIYT